MSKGFLIHAYNNEEIDYGTIALSSALLIKKNLRNNNLALITNDGTMNWMRSQHGKLVDRAFDHVEIVSGQGATQNRTFFDTKHSSKTLPYRNGNRADSYDLSPFDETILIDADYLVLDEAIDQAWGNTDDIMVNQRILSLSHEPNPSGFNSRLNTMGIPLYWATLLYFRKGDKAKALFDTMRFVKEHYDYYQNLYLFPPGGYFRNDYALSVALHMLYGQFENDGISSFPIDHIMVATEYDDMIGFANGSAYFISEHKPDQYLMHRAMTNVHVMNKWSLVRMSPRMIRYAIN